MADEIPLAPAGRTASPGASHSAPPAARLQEPPRRGFLVKSFAFLFGGLLAVVPLAAGFAAFLDPLRRKRDTAPFITVCPAEMVASDGTPKLFPVIADRVDAWNTYPRQPIGSVFLMRSPGSEQITAYNAICPHAGCMVAWQPASAIFQCPCHTSAFKLDGKRSSGVSPRDLDQLEVRVVDLDGRQEVQVRFQNFLPGIPEQKAKS